MQREEQEAPFRERSSPIHHSTGAGECLPAISVSSWEDFTLQQVSTIDRMFLCVCVGMWLVCVGVGVMFQARSTERTQMMTVLNMRSEVTVVRKIPGTQEDPASRNYI